eukprot:5438691-Pyramimonas_sp.AAC.1
MAPGAWRSDAPLHERGLKVLGAPFGSDEFVRTSPLCMRRGYYCTFAQDLGSTTYCAPYFQSECSPSLRSTMPPYSHVSRHSLGYNTMLDGIQLSTECRTIRGLHKLDCRCGWAERGYGVLPILRKRPDVLQQLTIKFADVARNIVCRLTTLQAGGHGRPKCLVAAEA